MAIFLSTTDLAFSFFVAFRSAWSWVLGAPRTPARPRREPRAVWILFLWSHEQGKIVLKNILTAVGTEASDESGSQPARGGEIATRGCSPDGRKIREGGCGQQMCHWEQCKLTEEVVVWCCVCQHAAVKRGCPPLN
jgi:hypothetical protein